MKKEEKCPYCGHPVTTAEYRQIRKRMDKERAERDRQIEQRLEHQYEKKLEGVRSKAERDVEKAAEKHEKQINTVRKQAKADAKKEARRLAEEMAAKEKQKYQEERERAKKLTEKLKREGKEVVRLQAQVEKAAEKHEKELEKLRRGEEVRIEAAKKDAGRAAKKEAEARAQEKLAKELKKAERERRRLEKAEAELEQQKATVKALKMEKRRAYDDGLEKGMVRSKSKVAKLEVEISKLQRRVDEMQSEERGTVREGEVLALLEAAFPLDAFRKVSRGESGADIIQTVRDRKGSELGTIVYEVKDTQTWLNKYLVKAKSYAEEYNTPHVIVVTNAFPKNEKHFAVKEGVLLVNKPLVRYVAEIVRKAIEEVSLSKLSQRGKQKKMSELYIYMSSPQFHESIKGVNRAVDALEKILKKERTEHESKWRERQKQLHRITALSSEIRDEVKDILEAPVEGKVVRLPVQTA